jgi:glycosyltransferase involved in cell wall biosynthesis
VRDAGASQVSVAQRFGRDLEIERQGVRYLVRGDGAGPSPRSWGSSPRLHAAVLREKPDVVHVNGLIFPGEVRRLRRSLEAACALVVQDHAGAPPTGRVAVSVRRHNFRAGLAEADGFLFTAQAQAEPWRSTGVLSAQAPIYEVPESSTRLRPASRAEARAATGMRGDPALLFVGHLDANKDPITLCEGFDRALPMLRDAHLTLVYQTEALLPALRAHLAARPLVASRVTLAGRVPHARLASFYSAADVFVLGSHHEGSGYALIEALACGVVPVVSDIPSFRVLTADGTLGALFTPGRPDELAAALTRVARMDIGALRRRILGHFESALSWTAVGRRALEIYGQARTRRGLHGT